MEILNWSNAYGGTGTLKTEKILDDEKLNGKCGLFARVTIPPGASLGYHEHHGNAETYFILSGSGLYDDNGTKRRIAAGDTTYTPDGSGHALSNEDGKEDLVFMALIINS